MLNYFYRFFISYIYHSNIDVYVISLRNKNRLNNIKEQQKKTKYEIKIFDAIRGDHLDLEELIKNKITDKKWGGKGHKITSRKREIGCFLSHSNLYNKIKYDNKPGYTIVFEDDFSIMINNFDQYIYDTINKLNKNNIDFDILYLGNWKNNHKDNIIDDIYTVDINTPLTGTHAMLFNNKNINKIVDNLDIADDAIDQKLKKIGRYKIKILVLYPIIIDQSGATTSDINGK